MIDNKNEKADYFKLLGSGMFWEIYPELTGEWEKDKDEFIKNEQWLNENFRNKMDAIGSKKHKIPTTSMNDFEKKFGKPKKLIDVKFSEMDQLHQQLESEPQTSPLKVTPILVLYMDIRYVDDIQAAFDIAQNSMEKYRDHGWTYLILPITDGRDSFVESHSVERLDIIELKELETKILETIKTGE